MFEALADIGEVLDILFWIILGAAIVSEILFDFLGIKKLFKKRNKNNSATVEPQFPSFCTRFSYPTTPDTIYLRFSTGLLDVISSIWTDAGYVSEYQKHRGDVVDYLKKVYYEDIAQYYAPDEPVTIEEKHKLEPRLLSIYFETLSFSYYKIFNLHSKFKGYPLKTVIPALAQTLVDQNIIREKIDPLTPHRLADSIHNIDAIINPALGKIKESM